MDNLLLTFIRILLLNLLHTLHTWYIALQSLSYRILHRPRSLHAPRSKLPRHLSLLLLPHEQGATCPSTLAHAIQIVAEHCLAAGVRYLSVFVEDQGLLEKLKLKVQCGPLVPDCDLFIQFWGSQHAKALLASTAQLLADTHGKKQGAPFSISVEQLGVLLESSSPTPPDVLLVYDFDIHRRQRPLNLSGYPPWQVCVTEIYQHRRQLPWGRTLRRDLEDSIRCCLDEYEQAEMRFGR